MSDHAQDLPPKEQRDAAWRSKAKEKLEKEIGATMPLGRYLDPDTAGRIDLFDELIKLLDRKARLKAALEQTEADLEGFFRSHPQEVYRHIRNSVFPEAKGKGKGEKRAPEPSAEPTLVELLEQGGSSAKKRRVGEK